MCKIHEAKTNLSKLIARVRGKDCDRARGNQPVVMSFPVQPVRSRRGCFGAMKGIWPKLPDAFFRSSSRGGVKGVGGEGQRMESLSIAIRCSGFLKATHAGSRFRARATIEDAGPCQSQVRFRHGNLPTNIAWENSPDASAHGDNLRSGHAIENIKILCSFSRRNSAARNFVRGRVATH